VCFGYTVNWKRFYNIVMSSDSEDSLWYRMTRRLRIQAMIQKSCSYYTDVLRACSRHLEDLHDKRVLKRYTYNDTIKLIRTAEEEITRIQSIPVRDLLTCGTSGMFRTLLSIVDRVVFSAGMSRVTDVIDYLSAHSLPREHAEWLHSVATPCVVSRENGPCKRIFFRNVTMSNPNSYVDNQCVWVSIPFRKNSHLSIKVVVGRDPACLIQKGFGSRIRILNRAHRSLLWAVHPRQIITSSTSELRLRIQSLVKTRERLGKTPVSKIINEFLSSDVNHQVTLFCALCIPGGAYNRLIRPLASPRIRPKNPDVTPDVNIRNRTYSICENPFITRDKIPRASRSRPPDSDDSDTTSDSEDDGTGDDTSAFEHDPDDAMAPLASTMYDIIANHGVVHRRDVTDAIDLLPWEVQRRIRNIRDYVYKKRPIHKKEIPREAQLQILPVDDSTKQVVYSRMHEANSRGGDSSTKAASWVNGFFRIPFGVYRKEPVLMRREQTLNYIRDLLGGEVVHGFHDIIRILAREYADIVTLTSDRRGLFWSDSVVLQSLRSIHDTDVLADIARDLGMDMTGSVTPTTFHRQLMKCSTIDAANVYAHITSRGGVFPENQKCSRVGDILNRWYSHRLKLSEALAGTRGVLDRCVRFQEDAKDHVMRIIGQWMVGKDSGYCLGFEGPPGIGKTTFAREGLANILKDKSGTPRPFRMIALGTATTGSTLVGHNYTYQSSQWGDVVRILMECECMNPIIYVDELDKVSQTESGREIISILTHLTDPAQNEEFQDRYFAGVKLDMSRVLFVFSYNDPSKIDPILLDRIHRVRFSALTTHEKLQVIRHHTLPEIAQDLRMPIGEDIPGAFRIHDGVIREVIHRYTNEAGLRKIREILQDTFREVNLRTIHAGNHSMDAENHPTDITLEFIENKVLRGRNRINLSVVDNHPHPSHTRVYGMFATGSGVGGVLPIRVSKDYGSKDQGDFSVRVTGSLGDVMKESVSIARTVCLWLHETLDIPLPKYGVHIHFPEGATPKDGPSAGSAICLALFAFARGLDVPGNLTLTGEMDIDGAVLQVGGISQKLTGAKRAGATRSVIPQDNDRDLENLLERIPSTEIPDTVVTASHIHDVFRIVYGEDWKGLVVSSVSG